jgi:glycosyltransferase involved in cell wall biosynthesis
MGTNGRRFVIDGSMARGGGGFTYLVNIVPELARLAPRDHFQIFVGDRHVAESVPAAGNAEIVFLGPLGQRERLRFTYREAARRAAAWGADLYFSAGELAPLRAPFPTIAAFRNPVVFAPREGLPPRQRARLWALNALARLSAARCDRILFVSEDSARWIGERTGVPEHRRAVVHHGIAAAAWRRPAKATAAAPYILSVSSVYPHKNYVRLIEAWTRLARRRPQTPDLVIIGDVQDAASARRMGEARSAAGALAERIHILGGVPYAQVRRYYAEAQLFVFPSYLETFGHPLLEAMASDLPLVAADIPAFREIAADAAFYADPFETASLASAMEDALFRVGAREQLVKRGRERLRDFTWQRSAEKLLSLFESVLAERAERVRAGRALSLPGLSPALSSGSTARSMHTSH